MTVGAFDPELFARYRKARAGSPLRSALENRLVIENTPLVKTLVDQMLGRGEVKRRGKFGSQRQAFAAIDWDEAMQAGRIALMKALQGFDPSKSKLSSYLVWKVRYELQCLIGRGKKAVELDLVGVPGPTGVGSGAEHLRRPDKPAHEGRGPAHERDRDRPARSRKPSEARRRFYALLKADGWSLGRIGRLVGRCHPTILHELRVHAGNRPKRKRAAKT